MEKLKSLSRRLMQKWVETVLKVKTGRGSGQTALGSVEKLFI